MVVHCLNCMTCSARIPSCLHTGALCLLVETSNGLVLVDTGLGTLDYRIKPAVLQAFRVATIVPLNPEEAAVRQIRRLGYAPEDVRDIVLTHMHFDHAGGIPDFPHATVHVHRREWEAFTGPRQGLLDVAYVRRHMAHELRLARHAEVDALWFGYPAITLPFAPEMLLVPLFGHTRGHCGVAIKGETEWLLHAGDAVPVGAEPFGPAWLSRLVLGPHCEELLRFRAAHPEIRMTAGHMPLAFFDSPELAPGR